MYIIKCYEESRARGRDSRWLCLRRVILYKYIHTIHTIYNINAHIHCNSTVYVYARPLIVLKSDIEVDV